MATDYKKLTEDLIKARIAGEEAAKGDDGGSANLDTMTIKLPRAREKKVIEAVGKAGLNCGKIEWLGVRYFIYPPSCGQGNSRYRAVKAMTQFMRQTGWDVLTYCQMD